MRVTSAESELSNSGRKSGRKSGCKSGRKSGSKSGRKSGCKSGRKSVYFLNAVAVISGNKQYLSFYEVRVVLRNGWL